MHDYYPIIARAVSRLMNNTPDARHDLFERIRKILIEQLRIRQPPPATSDFNRERAALEAAIRRVESECGTNTAPRITPAAVSSVRRSTDDTHPRILEHKALESVASCGPRPVEDTHHVGRETTETASTHEKRDRFPSGESGAHRLNALYERLRDPLADQGQHHLPSERRSNADVGPIWRTHARSSRSLSQDETFVMGHDPRAETTAPDDAYCSAASQTSKYGLQEAAPRRLNDLFFTHCLTELLRDSSGPMAPESLKRDSDALLKWLAVTDLHDLTPKHYAIFTWAFRAYVMEWEDLTLQRGAETGRSSPPITDDVRAIFGRMLERAQSATLFDKALLLFSKIWLGLLFALNGVASIVVIITAPTLEAGLAKFAATYSPLNLWCWVCQFLALSPAIIAMYVRHEHMTEREDTTSTRAGATPGHRRYRRALRWRTDRKGSRFFALGAD